jgi:hypothetical protein
MFWGGKSNDGLLLLAGKPGSIHKQWMKLTCGKAVLDPPSTMLVAPPFGSSNTCG